MNAAISRVQQEPATDSESTVNRLTFATFPILGYSLTTTTHRFRRADLWELATYTLKPPLNRVDGVATVTVQGGQIPEYHVIPNMARLQAPGVTILDLANAIGAANIIDSPGLYPQGITSWCSRWWDLRRTTWRAEAAQCKTTATGAPVRVADLAEVMRAAQPVYTYVSANGSPQFC